MTKIKICGLCRREDIDYINQTRPDYCGFIVDVPFSSRSVSPEQLSRLGAELDRAVCPVGVFVNAPPKLVAHLLNERLIHIAQLHGQEDETYLETVRSLCGSSQKPVLWKAFSISCRQDLDLARKSSADMILLDHGRGGSGRQFDWSLLASPPAGFTRPYILAGGLSPANIPEAIRRYRPWGIDLSSSVETNGYKDISKIKAAIAAVRSVKL